MRHSHCSVLCIFYFIQISSNRRKLRHRYLFLSIVVAWRLASAHTCWFAIKRNAYMCLCVNHPMEERKNPRRKASVWKWVAAGSSLVNMAKWQKKGSPETHLTREKQRSNICLLSATCKPRQSYTLHMQPNTGQAPRTAWRRSQSAGVRCLVNIFGLGRKTERLCPLCDRHGESLPGRVFQSFTGNLRQSIQIIDSKRFIYHR